jgi:hypothetical protein
MYVCVSGMVLSPLHHLLIFYVALIKSGKPGQSRRIFRAKKNPQHALLRRESKAVGPM